MFDKNSMSALDNIKIPKPTLLEKRNLTTVPFLQIWFKEVRRFWKVRSQTLFSPLIQSTLYLLIFGVSLGKSVTLESGISYLEFLIPGLIMMSALNNAFQNCSGSIVTSKFHGDIQDWKLIPISDYKIVFALGLGGLVRGFSVATITFITCEVFYFFINDEILKIQNPLLFLLFLSLGGMAFGFIGVTIGFWAKGFDYVNAVGGFVLLPLLYLGGVFYSLESLHPFWQSISKLNPLLYFVNGVRYGFLGISDLEWKTCLLLSVVFMLVFVFTSCHQFKKGSFSRW